MIDSILSQGLYTPVGILDLPDKVGSSILGILSLDSKKDWVPFPPDLKDRLFEIYSAETHLYEWSEQDIYQGSRKIIANYFSNTY